MWRLCVTPTTEALLNICESKHKVNLNAHTYSRTNFTDCSELTWWRDWFQESVCVEGVARSVHPIQPARGWTLDQIPFTPSSSILLFSTDGRNGPKVTKTCIMLQKLLFKINAALLNFFDQRMSEGSCDTERSIGWWKFSFAIIVINSILISITIENNYFKL